jgi:hypothetical protein
MYVVILFLISVGFLIFTLLKKKPPEPVRIVEDKYFVDCKWDEDFRPKYNDYIDKIGR